jgi:hypothetical protein
MKTLLLLLGLVGMIAGLLFAAQGAGLVNWPQSSFMVNSSDWIFYGLVIAGVGLVLIGLSARRS